MLLLCEKVIEVKDLVSNKFISDVKSKEGVEVKSERALIILTKNYFPNKPP